MSRLRFGNLRCLPLSIVVGIVASTAVNIASIKVINIGTGSTSFGGNTDVTINNILDGSTLGSEFSATLTKIATNSWIVSE